MDPAQSKSAPQSSTSKDNVKDKAEKKEMKRLAAELALGKELNAKSIEYESLRKLYKERTSQPSSSTSGAISFLAIDFETWESGTNRSDMTLEVGWSVATTAKDGLDSSNSSLKQHTFHYVNEDLLHLRNGRFVADHRDEFIFGPNYQNGSNGGSSSNSDLGIRTALGDSFGKSFNSRGTRKAKPREIGLALSQAIDYLKKVGTLFVVFHDSQGDLKDLAEIQVPTLGWNTNYPSSKNPNSSHLEIKQGEVYVLDTQRYTSALMQQKTGGRLGKMAESCEIEGGMKMEDMKLHNGANDAHITLATLLQIASGPPLSEYRPIFKERLSKIEEEQKGWSKKRQKGFTKAKKSKTGQANEFELDGAMTRDQLLAASKEQSSSTSTINNDHQVNPSSSGWKRNAGNVGLNLLDQGAGFEGGSGSNKSHKRW